MASAEFHLLISHNSQQTVYHSLGGRGTLLETEAPGIDQRRHGDVEGAVGVGRDLLRHRKHIGEEVVDLDGLVAVYARDDGGLVKRRERVVYLLQLVEYPGLQVAVVLVHDAVGGAEYHALVVLVGHRPVLAHDDDRRHNQKEQKHTLPYQFLLACSLHIDDGVRVR